MARRRWEFDLADGSHVVELEHGYFFGRRLLRADGDLISQRGRPLTDHSGVYPFRFGAHEGQIVITTNGLTYRYQLVVDGRDVTTGSPSHYPRPQVGSPRQMQIGGVIFGLLALPMLWFGARGLVEEYRYRVDGVDAIAVAADRREISGRRTSYVIEYFFALPNGRFVGGRGTVSESSYERAVPGARYRIEYVASEPELNRFKGRSDLWAAALVTLVPVATLGLMARSVLVARHRAKFEHRVREIGVFASARVRKQKLQYLRGHGKSMRLEYEYEDGEGRPHRGITPHLYPDEAARYPEGAALKIRYDPDRPRDSVWMDDRPVEPVAETQGTRS